MPYNKIKIYATLGMLVVLTLILNSNVTRTRADNLANRVFDGHLEVTIHEGPSAISGPVTLSGNLRLKIDPSGGFTGVLTPSEGQSSVIFGNLSVEDPTRIDVVGQINGRAFNLILELGNGKRIYGSGTMKNDLSKVKDAGGIGGTATGPESGDRDDWICDGSVRFVR
jgi:hypothetical protein